MEFDEKELRREIAFAIRNIHGRQTSFLSKKLTTEPRSKRKIVLLLVFAFALVVVHES